MIRPKHREFSVPSDTAYLGNIRNSVLELVGHGIFPPGVAQLLALAVDEAVANIMEHGYTDHAGKEAKEIQVVLDVAPQRFEVRILDTGRAFNPTLVPDVDIQEHVRTGRRGGLGLYLIRQIMDEIHYSLKSGARNELHMIKYIDNPPRKARSDQSAGKKGVQGKCP